ncbi:hypothetical protein TSAR_014136 [Trichomalopsis sarcophagae]|uniref:Uncharacterized protein n=1 Tax=Trichomalopsis sarcophagae TaxID=543379 RepID=A0A232F5S6_9HYME|nr:hypothetical protein TSAR_014136 [Trichomalopsis sarcophagae]
MSVSRDVASHSFSTTAIRIGHIATDRPEDRYSRSSYRTESIAHKGGAYGIHTSCPPTHTHTRTQYKPVL